MKKLIYTPNLFTAKQIAYVVDLNDNTSEAIDFYVDNLEENICNICFAEDIQDIVLQGNSCYVKEIAQNIKNYCNTINYSDNHLNIEIKESIK